MRIPFTPAIYEHAAQFTGHSPWRVSRDPELMFQGHRLAYLEYRHQVIVVGIDIYNLEAEAYGAHVEEPAGDVVPAIARHPLRSLEEGLDLRPYNPLRDGRVAQAIAVAQRLKAEFPEADVRLPVAGPFSIAFNLRGISNLCEDALTRPDETRAFLMRLAENQGPFCRAVADAGLDIAFFESAAAPPILSPRLFRQVELPALQRVLEVAALSVGHPVPCIMGGNTFPILGDLLSTGTSYLVSNVETNQMRFVERVAQTHSHVKIRVNLNPVDVAGHDETRLLAEVDRLLVFTEGRPNCLMGTGALPFETPPRNVHRIREYLGG